MTFSPPSVGALAAPNVIAVGDHSASIPYGILASAPRSGVYLNGALGPRSGQFATFAVLNLLLVKIPSDL